MDLACRYREFLLRIAWSSPLDSHGQLILLEGRVTCGLNTWKTAASFGYLKDCCKVIWIHEKPLQGLDTYTWKTAAALGVEPTWSTPGPVWGHVGNWSMNAHISSMLLLNSLGYAHWDASSSNCLRSISLWNCCVHSSVSNVAGPTLGVLQASTPKAEVFQIVQ